MVEWTDWKPTLVLLGINLLYIYGGGAVFYFIDENNEEYKQTVFDYFYFAFTVSSTIGYGHVIPVSAASKMVYVLYAVTGIPLFFTFIISVGTNLNEVINKIHGKLVAGPRQHTRWTKIGAMILFGLVIFVIIPSAVVTLIEDWSFADGLYFMVTSLSTVGFGDMIVSTESESSTDINSSHWYAMLFCHWIWLGLIWIAAVVCAVVDKTDKHIMLLEEETEMA